MESTELYQQILGLHEPWYVAAVALEANAAAVTIQLAHRTGKGVFQCPRCQQSAPVYDHSVGGLHKKSSGNNSRLPPIELPFQKAHTATIPNNQSRFYGVKFFPS